MTHLQDRLKEIELIGWPEYKPKADPDWEKRSHGSAAIKHVEQPRCPELGSVPTAETLPLTEAQPFTHREGVHKHQDYRPTLLGPSHCSEKNLTGRPYADALVDRQTRMTGRANKKGWKTPQHTAKTQAKLAKAGKWARKFL